MISQSSSSRVSRCRICRPRSFTVRHESTALHFYQNKQLDLYASREAKRLTLRQLVFFGRSMTEERLIQSANYVRTELPVRIAHRLRDLQALPYVVVTQEGVAKVYELYWSAFEQFRRYPPITNIKENEAFCEFLRRILDEHGSVIPNLSLGLSISSPYLTPDALDSFMRRMLVSRISRRVLTQHHLALSDTFVGKKSTRYTDSEPRVGIIYTGLDVRRSIEKCAKLLKQRPSDVGSDYEGVEMGAVSPEVVIEGNLETKFSYIREHLEYIVFELLKNSMRATRLKHRQSSSVPPIVATIALGANDIGIRISDQGGGFNFNAHSPQVKTPSDLCSFSHVRNPQRMEDSRLGTLRSVSSRREGVWATVHEQVESWQKPQDSENGGGNDDPGKKAGVGRHSRLGIGLPMSNIFATYLGGSLDIVSLDGWGTDVYVRLPKLVSLR
ncbi:alpha-ketoacid dehydrogenase kinase [Dendrothele bispora CBS 962.96]|uniref:Protein-serine/threonine kinase n=1 Tax=Dendrothele bispora (strain CBS 962.96) TaxID=1314807 RepID=A0A4S8N0F0_DENBC|nr:alpha-ketoacid dehydrogenase kinase [Dendrothele bispora CBS 962.96]